MGGQVRSGTAFEIWIKRGGNWRWLSEWPSRLQISCHPTWSRNACSCLDADHSSENPHSIHSGPDVHVAEPCDSDDGVCGGSYGGEDRFFGGVSFTIWKRGVDGVFVCVRIQNVSKNVDNPFSDQESLTTSNNSIMIVAVLHTNTLLPSRNPNNPLDKSAFAQSPSSNSTARSPQAQSIVENSYLGLASAAF